MRSSGPAKRHWYGVPPVLARASDLAACSRRCAVNARCANRSSPTTVAAISATKASAARPDRHAGMRTFPSGREKSFGLGRANEVVERNAADIVRGKPDLTTAPAELEIGVMVFALGYPAKRVDEGQCLREIGKLEILSQITGLRTKAPTRQFGQQRVDLRARKRMLRPFEGLALHGEQFGKGHGGSSGFGQSVAERQRRGDRQAI